MREARKLTTLICPRPVRAKRLSILVAVLSTFLLLIAACSADGRATSEGAGALGEALEANSSSVDADISFTGVGLAVRMDEEVSDLGLFELPSSTTPVLDLGWEIEVQGYACPDCKSGVRLDVDSVIFVDRFTKTASHATSAGFVVDSDMSSPFMLNSESVEMALTVNESHCLILLSTVRLLHDNETVATVNVDSMYQIGEAETTACSLAEQSESAGQWEATEPEPSFGCRFGRLLSDPETLELSAEVTACENTQLLVAVPLNPSGVSADCCFHWYGVPHGKPGSILRQDIDDLESGAWRTILLIETPTTPQDYDGPYVVFGWPGVVVKGE